MANDFPYIDLQVELACRQNRKGFPVAWRDQNDLNDARREGLREGGTLYGYALPLKDEAELTNLNFLARLVDASQINQSQADQHLRVIQEFARSVTQELLKEYNRVLFYASLPETYAYADIAELLVKTAQLSDPAKVGTRLRETGGITGSVISGMSGPDGHGLWIAFQELGLRHRKLAIAHARSGEFPFINQVGLAYTLLTFSYTPFEAMKRGGREVPDPAVRESWLATWNIVGSLMGIEDHGLPTTLDEAARLLGLIRASAGYQRTEAGVRLLTTLTGIKPDKKASFAKYAGRELIELLSP
jgi:hypothetical protein